MRLIDKLISAGKAAANVPVVVVDNVANYLSSVAGAPGAKVRYINDLPCARPPFEHMWIEARRPDSWERNGASMWGYLIERFPDADEEGVDAYLLQGFAEIATGLGRASQLDAVLYIAPDGSPRSARTKDPNGSSPESSAAWCLYSTCFALSLMHCRNVTASEVVVSSAARQTKAGKNRIKRYSVLKIDPMRDVLRREGNIATNGLAKALHICRGHFKRYDKPLFGKTFTGTVWVPAHVRGSADKGVVDKGYNVAAPPKPKGNA